MSGKMQDLLQQVNELFSAAERNNSLRMWSDLTEFLLNNQSGLFLQNGSSSAELTSSSTPGSKRTQRVFSSTGPRAAQDLASAFQGTLTNAATIWSKIRLADNDLNNVGPVVAWTEDCNNRMHRKFQESNLYDELGKSYLSLIVLANMALLSERDDDTGKFVYTSLHMSQVAWAEDKNSLVDTVFYKYVMTAKQAYEKWGDECHESIIKALEKTPQREFDFVHAIYPRKKELVEVNDMGLAPGEKRPIASVHLDVTNQKPVAVSGYYEMPIFAVRWGLMPGERYGRGPGHLALPDVKTLNVLVERGLQTLALQVRPPIFANSRDIIGPLDFSPGGISIVSNHEGFREFVTQANVQASQMFAERLEASIQGLFFLDKLMLPPRTETGEMTAFEVAQRVEQMQRVLGPVLSRVNTELLNPLIIRTFKSMLRNGEFLPVPDVLKVRGIDIDIVFVNQLARAQQIQDVTVIQQWVQSIMLIAQAKPEVLDNLNVDGIAKHTAKVLGVPEIAVQNDDVMQDMRQQRAQAQQQAMAMEAATQASEIGSNLGAGNVRPE